MVLLVKKYLTKHIKRKELLDNMKLLFENWRRYLLEKNIPTVNIGSLQVIDANKLWWGKVKQKRRRKTQPKMIVIHKGAQKPSTTVSTFNKRGTSSHFEVDKKGRIFQYLNPSRYTAAHSGNSHVNANSIGIDVSSGAWTPEQIQSTEQLVTALCSAYNIPQVVAPDTRLSKFDKNIVNFVVQNEIGILRHRNIVNTKCPGSFPVDDLGEESKLNTGMHLKESAPIKIKVGVTPLEVEVASDKDSIEKGLMHRDELGPDSGMLFMFPEPEEKSFWMKNTNIPLSIAYVGADNKILNIEDMEPHDTTGVKSKGKAKCAIEANKGWFDSKGVKAGDYVNLPTEELEEQTEPFQKYGRSTYRKFIIKLSKQGPNKYNVGGAMKKPSVKHLKSGPPG